MVDKLKLSELFDMLDKYRGMTKKLDIKWRRKWELGGILGNKLSKWGNKKILLLF